MVVRRFGGVLVGVFLSAFSLAQAPADDADKLPVPDAAAQEQAQQLVREVYGEEYDNAKTAAEKTALAKKMLGQADETAGEPATQFVLLRVARDVAMGASDAETSLAAVDRIAQAFDVDGMAMKEETLQAITKAARMSSQFKAVAHQVPALVEAAVGLDDYPRAVRLAELGIALARRAREYRLAKQIADRLEEVKLLAAAYSEMEKAQVVLESDPTDPAANFTVGRYLCLTKGDWRRGVAMLALAGDTAMKSLAVAELKGPATLDEQVALADGWWDLAQTKADSEHDALLLHAGSWYQKAQPQLSGLVRVKVDERLADVAKIGKPPPIATAPSRPTSKIPKGAVLALTFEKDTFYQDGGKSRVKDMSDQGNHGVVHGGRPVPGRAGQGLLLASRGDHIDCGNAESLDPTNAVTVSAWIMGRRWNATTRKMNDLVSNDDWEGGRPKGYVLRCDQQGKPDFNVGSRRWKGAMSEQAMQQGQWYHLVGRYDRSEVSLFINGDEVATTESSLPIRPSSFPLIIGRGTYDKVRRFDGIIDEVAVFNRALSDDEIKTLYQMGLGGKALVP